MKACDPQILTNQIDLVLFEDFLNLYPVYMNTLRWQLFTLKGPSCVACGITGTHAVVWHETKETSVIHTDLIWIDPNDPENVVLITMDHTIPRSKGGPKNLDNLQPMCSPCNSIKGDSLIPLDKLFVIIEKRKKDRYINIKNRQIRALVKKQEHDHRVRANSDQLPCPDECYICMPLTFSRFKAQSSCDETVSEQINSNSLDEEAQSLQAVNTATL